MSLTLLNYTLTAVFTVLAAAAVRRELAGTGARRDNEIRHYGAVLLGIALIGIFIRVWRFGAIPAGFNQDGAMAAVDGKALADYGTDRFGTRLPCHLYGWGYGQMSALLSYLIALCVRLWGLSPVTARLPQLIASLAGGAFFYLFVRDSFGRRTGLIAAALLAVNPWHLLQSRWALDCNLLPHFFIAALYFLRRGLGGRRPALYASMLCFALCMYCYGITAYAIPPLLLGLCAYLLIKKRLSVRDALLCAALYLILSAPFLLTMAVNLFGWDTIELPFVTIQRFPDSVRAGDILFFCDDPLSQLGTNLRSLVDVVILQKKDLPWNDMAGFGTMYLFSLPLLICGVFALLRSEGDGRRLTCAALLTALWVGLITGSVNVNRINLCFYFVLLLDALGLELILRQLPRTAPVCVTSLALAAALMVGCYFTDYADSIRHSFYDGFGDALLAAEDSGAPVIYVTADTQYHGSRSVSEILTLFYDRTDAEYFQGVDRGEALPYAERFVYRSMDSAAAEDALRTGAALVIRTEDAQYFDSRFTLTRYGDYICAVIA